MFEQQLEHRLQVKNNRHALYYFLSDEKEEYIKGRIFCTSVSL